MEANCNLSIPNPTMSTTSSKKKIAIIGAGTVGLSVALRTLELLEETAEVSIIAESFLNQTTSFGSGGLWEPYQIAGTPDSLVNKWGKFAFDHFLSLHNGPDAAESGVQLLTAYNLLQEGQDTTPPSWKDLVFNFTVLDAHELEKMGLPHRFVTAFSFGTLVIDQKYYMQYLTKQLARRGVIFQQRKVASIEEFRHAGYDVVVNCTGLGAAELLGDEEMYPIRGQVIRVKAPWVNSIWFWGTSYIIPNVDTVVLGGTAQKGNWSTTTSVEDTDKILDDIYELFPSIREAPIENVWAGLRPGRTPLRLESETIRAPEDDDDEGDPRELHVVHCYGHGGSGITLAMGCADDVVTNHLMPLLGLSPAAVAGAQMRACADEVEEEDGGGYQTPPGVASVTSGQSSWQRQPLRSRL